MPIASAARDSYAHLTPDFVLDALASVGLTGDGRLLQLNSYENRVFQVFLEDGRVVVTKFYRPARWSDAQILEEHAFALELAAAEIPVVPPLVFDDRTLISYEHGSVRHRFSVSERRAGRAPELDDPDVLLWLGRFIGRIHAIGTKQAFTHRRALDVATLGHAPRRLLLEREVITQPQEAGWRSACDAALDAVQAAFDTASPLHRLRLHGDCHPGNVLWRDADMAGAEGTAGPHFVDLDDACNGPAIQDLWMLISGDRASMSRQLATLLEGYEAFMRFDARELVLIEALRTLRMIHHSAWIAERWDDPAFPSAFPWFGSAAYWSQQTTQLREQLEAMAEPPIAV